MWVLFWIEFHGEFDAQVILDGILSGRIISKSELKSLELTEYMLQIIQRAIRHTFYFWDCLKTIVYISAYQTEGNEDHDMAEIVQSLDSSYNERVRNFYTSVIFS